MDRTFRDELRKCPFTGKPMYDKKGAVTAKNLRWRNDHIELRVYNCPCGKWHLTKQPNE